MKSTKFYQLGSGVIFAAGLCFLASRSFAQGPDFEKRKAERLAEIDQRIQKLQEHRTCVSGAPSHDALRKCVDEMREWRRDERNEHREQREERKNKK